MNLLKFLASLFLAGQVPAGMYTGSKSLFGETINAVVNINDARSLDFAISGDIALDCKDEDYSLEGNQIVLSDIELVGDCAHDALMDYEIILKGIVYDDASNEITVTVKYSVATIDVVLSSATASARKKQFIRGKKWEM
jgi:hypothetical protein